MAAEVEALDEVDHAVLVVGILASLLALSLFTRLEVHIPIHEASAKC